MDKISLPVKGMSCAHCEARVNTAVEALPGVKKCKANAKKGEVTFKFDPEVTGPDAVKVAIRQAGYEAE